MFESLHSIDDYGRFNTSEPIRQGLVYKKTIKFNGSNMAFQKWQLVFAIVSKEGFFFFAANNPEADHAKGYIMLNESELKIQDINTPGKFLFEVTTTTTQTQFECQNFTEKDEWKKALQKARPLAQQHTRLKSPAPTTPPTSSPKESENGSGFKMSAEVKILVKEAKNLQNVQAPFCKVILNDSVKTTNFEKKSGNLHVFQQQELGFKIEKLPVDFLLLMYDQGGKEVVGTVQFKIELAGERGDQRDWLDVRSVILEEKKPAGQVFVVIKTRYDAETQKRVTFGVRLGDLMKRESHQNLVIPDIAYKCLKSLNRQHCLEMQGIFRVPGNRNKMREYEIRFDTEGSKVEFVKSDDEHMIASMFKMFLRDLPEPLVPYQLFDEAVESATKPTKEQIVIALRDLVAKLPPENFRLLSLTCCLLYKITLYVEKNLMKPTNLAIVFGPVFCSAPPGNEVTRQQMVAKLPALSAAAEHMIIEYHSIFGVDKGVDPLNTLGEVENKLSAFNAKLSSSNASSSAVSPEQVLVHSSTVEVEGTSAN